MAEKNITRFFFGGGATAFDYLTVEELMAENEDFEDSAAFWIADLVGQGFHDDSDWSSPATICIYVTESPEALRAEFEAWKQTHGDLLTKEDSL